MSLTEKSEIQKSDIKRLKECMNEIEQDPVSFNFLDPVPWKKLGLFDYPDVIQKPMNLRKVRQQLVQGRYKRYAGFFNDI